MRFVLHVGILIDPETKSENGFADPLRIKKQ